jgi:hypothetical protein
MIGKLISLVGSSWPLVGGFFLLVVSLNLSGQGMNQEFLECVTTILSIEFTEKDGSKSSGTGTGIFYYEDRIGKAPRFWIISNRHVLYPKDRFPDKLTLHLRVSPNPNIPPIWHNVVFNSAQVKSLLRTYEDPEIDVAILDITKAFKIAANTFKSSLLVRFIEKNMRADALENFNVEIGNQLLTIGYPFAVYDDYNLTPIVKSGTVGSSYGRRFKNRPLFLIDCILYPGSSGSLVLSPPSKSLQLGSAISVSEYTHAPALGIYSGVPLFEVPDPENPTKTEKSTLGFGNVWYFWLIDDLMSYEKPN